MAGKTDVEERLRRLPSVDRLLQIPAGSECEAVFGHDLTVEAMRETLDAARRRIAPLAAAGRTAFHASRRDRVVTRVVAAAMLGASDASAQGLAIGLHRPGDCPRQTLGAPCRPQTDANSML